MSPMTSPEFPTVSGPIMIDGPVGPLEASVDLPEGDVTPLPLVVVLCNPLSTEGGSMHNKVVTMAARSLRELGATTVRFNFRSVGESAGNFDHGNGERDDLLAVVAWVSEQRPRDDLWLAGFSFGAYVSLRAAHAVQPEGLISIAPPVGRSWSFDDIALPAVPWLLIQGEADEIVDANAVFEWVATLARPPMVVKMPDTSHFFHRKLIDLRGAVKHGVRDWLPAPPAACATARGLFLALFGCCGLTHLLRTGCLRSARNPPELSAVGCATSCTFTTLQAARPFT